MANSAWKEYSLGELIDVSHGYAFKGEYFSDEPTENILLTPGNFNIGGGFKADKFKYYKGDVPQEYILRPGEVIVTMTDLSKESDTLGYSAIVPQIDGRKVLHNQRLGRVKLRSDKADLNFLNWVLRTEEYRWHVLGSASGSTVSHTSPLRIMDYRFLLPPLPEQRAIAGILSSLDDKVALLHRQNKTLESIAAILWRKMFKENIVDTWEFGSIREVCDVLSGFAVKSALFAGDGKYRLITIKNVKDARLDLEDTDFLAEIPKGMPKHCLLKKRDILLSLTGNVGRCCLVTEDNLLLNQRVAKLQPRNPSNFAFVYTMFRLPATKSLLEELAKGTAQVNLSPIELGNLQIQIPPEEVLLKYSQLAAPIMDDIFSNTRQIQTLSSLRDALLQKLMSGEVEAQECH